MREDVMTAADTPQLEAQGLCETTKVAKRNIGHIAASEPLEELALIHDETVVTAWDGTLSPTGGKRPSPFLSCKPTTTSRVIGSTHPGPLIVPTLVITEVVYLIASRLGWQAETRFLGDLAAGEMSLEPVDRKDTLRIAELVARYHDLPLGTVDASVIAAAERLGVTEVATLDLHHFTVVRPHHVEAFNLLPGRG